MPYRTFKTLFLITLFTFGIFVFPHTASAFAPTTLSEICSISGGIARNTGGGGNSISPAEILCPLVRVFNLLVIVSVIIAIIYVGYGGIKASMALGDAKGYAAAKQTWIYALYGMGVVLLFFVIILIMDRLLGIGIIQNGPVALLDRIVAPFIQFLQYGGVEYR